MSSLHAASAVMPRSMARCASVSHRGAGLLGAVLAVSLFTAAPIISGAFAPVQAQAPSSHVSVAFRAALGPYGRWERHSHWGAVWMPANRARDWRPYTLGRWVYSNDWGWYWAEDQEEAAWGWVAYHYGRWVFDREIGWAWIPGEEWGPAFVQWRHGGDYVGWAPMPPDEILVEYRDQPDVWIFCRARDFGAARLAGVIIAPQQYPLFMRETIVVNQTVVLRDRGHFAVDPGIPPAFIAAAIGRPLRTFDVRPRILAGTAPVPGATVVRPQDLNALRDRARNRNFGPQTSVRETPQTIAPSARGTQLKPLAAGERGRLGDNPPRVAQEPQRAQPLQQRQGQPQPQQQQQQQQQQQGQQQPSQSTTQGRGQQPLAPTREREEGRRLQNQQQGKQDQQPGGAAREREPAQTQGRSSDQQRQLREESGQRSQDRATERSRPSDTQGRGSAERRQQIDPERRGARPQQRPDTEGRRQIAPERQQPQTGRGSVDPGRAGARPQEQRSAPSAMEGRSGGGGHVAPAQQQHGPSGPSGGGAPPRAAPSGAGPAGATEGRGHSGPRP